MGSAFKDPKAVAELQTIASPPPEAHVFRVDNFEALRGIQEQLQDKIFAIEGMALRRGPVGRRGPAHPTVPPGTQPAFGSSFQLEMAQEGFSALLTPVSVPTASPAPHACLHRPEARHNPMRPPRRRRAP